MTLTEEMKKFLLGYTPEEEGFTSRKEMDQIAENLGLGNGSRDYLFELRNEVVMFYTDAEMGEIIYDGNGEYAGRTARFWKLSQALMSVTAVIDHYKYNAGVPVHMI